MSFGGIVCNWSICTGLVGNFIGTSALAGSGSKYPSDDRVEFLVVEA
jgi:hypothetical protein